MLEPLICMADLFNFGITPNVDYSISYFDTIKHESMVFLVAEKGGNKEDFKLMQMITEAMQITYADRGNYTSIQDTDLRTITGLRLDNFASNFTSYSLSNNNNENLVDWSDEQFQAILALRSLLARNLNNLSVPESLLAQNRFNKLMQIGDSIETYFQDPTIVALGADAKNQDKFRDLRDQWFNQYNLIAGLISGDTVVNKVITALGGINGTGSFNPSNINSLVSTFQSTIRSGADPATLDFNSDGSVDSADYRELLRVLGDRRNESAFDALMTQEIFNLDKLDMSAALMSNTTNLSPTDRAIHNSIYSLYEGQSEVNNYVVRKLNGSNFANPIAETEFNNLDEKNERIERELKGSLGTATFLPASSSSITDANRASNNIVLLALGFTKDDARDISDRLRPDFRLTEALNGSAETILGTLRSLKSNNEIDINELAAMVQVVLDKNPDSTTLSTAQVNKIKEYAARPGDLSAELATYMSLVVDSAPSAKFTSLDNYIKASPPYNLSSSQEATYLKYLNDSSNEKIADSYLGFYRATPPATSANFATLHSIFEGSDNKSIRDLLSINDLKFEDTLVTLRHPSGLNVSSFRATILDKFQNVEIDHLNAFLDKLVLARTNGLANGAANNLISAYSSILNSPTASILTTPPPNLTLESHFLNSTLGKNPDITLELLNNQIEVLGDMGNNPTVVAALNQANSFKAWAQGAVPLQNTYNNLSASEKLAYDSFLTTFPNASLVQREDAMSLISGNYAFADNKDFMASYGKLLAAGNTSAANKLKDIAVFYGAGANVSSLISQMNNSNISAEAVDTAHAMLVPLQAMNPPSDYTNSINETNEFLILNVLRGSGTYNSTEGPVTQAFTGAIKVVLDGNQNLTEENNFIAMAVRNFETELGLNGLITPLSRTEQIKNRLVLNEYNRERAAMQIKVFEAMIGFYDTQISSEQSKSTPDITKIATLTAQKQSHEAAIAQLMTV